MALYGQLRVSAGRGGVSLQDWLVEAVREKVGRDGAGGVGAGVGVSASSVSGGSGCSGGGVGGGDVGVVADHVSGALTGAAFLAALVQAVPPTGSDTSPGLVSEFFDPLQDIA